MRGSGSHVSESRAIRAQLMRRPSCLHRRMACAQARLTNRRKAASAWQLPGTTQYVIIDVPLDHRAEPSSQLGDGGSPGALKCGGPTGVHDQEDLR